MQAIICKEYGPPEDLQLQELPTPTPTAREILVRVRAAAVNDYDWCMVRGVPWLYRLFFGLRRPKRPIPGMEVAGVVEACGPDVTQFAVGDEVYGDTSEYGFGCFAEYVCLDELALQNKPEGLSFEEAAALSHASMLAYQALHDLGGLRDGQKILVNGAGGGVGLFALQLAKQRRTEVTGVDAGDKLTALRELGYDHVLDYRQDDFTQRDERYDLILDCKLQRSPLAAVRALRPGGVCAVIGGYPGRLLQTLALGPWIRRFTGKTIRILNLKPNKDLDAVETLAQSGELRFVLDGPYSLEECPQLLRRFGEGKHTGKIVLRMENS